LDFPAASKVNKNYTEMKTVSLLKTKENNKFCQELNQSLFNKDSDSYSSGLQHWHGSKLHITNKTGYEGGEK